MKALKKNKTTELTSSWRKCSEDSTVTRSGGAFGVFLFDLQCYSVIMGSVKELAVLKGEHRLEKCFSTGVVMGLNYFYFIGVLLQFYSKLYGLGSTPL